MNGGNDWNTGFLTADCENGLYFGGTTLNGLAPNTVFTERIYNFANTESTCCDGKLA